MVTDKLHPSPSKWRLSFSVPKFKVKPKFWPYREKKVKSLVRFTASVLPDVVVAGTWKIKKIFKYTIFEAWNKSDLKPSLSMIILPIMFTWGKHNQFRRLYWNRFLTRVIVKMIMIYNSKIQIQHILQITLTCLTSKPSRVSLILIGCLIHTTLYHI